MVGITFGICVYFLSIISYSSEGEGSDFIFPIKSFEGVRNIREALNITNYYLEQSQEFMFGGNLCELSKKKRKCRRKIAILKERYEEMVEKYINRKQMCKYVFKNCNKGRRLHIKPTYKCLSCQATVFLSNGRRIIKANNYVIKLFCSREKTWEKQRLCMKKIYGYMGIYNNVRVGTQPLWFCMKYGYCTKSILDYDFSEYDQTVDDDGKDAEIKDDGKDVEINDDGKDTEIYNEDRIYELPSNSTIYDMNIYHTHDSEDLNLSGATYPSTHNPNRGRYRYRHRWSHPDELFYHYHGNHHHYRPDHNVGWNVQFGLLPFFNIVN